MPALLLIEDNADLRKVLTEAVEMYGYSVTIARDAEEALALIAGGYQPDVIVSDISLPHMDGLEFLTRIRQYPPLASVLFIAMSGTFMMKQEALDAGADYYLVKPFSFHDLFDMLQQ